jgi:two-component system, chemotaxis family, chemotaxis protein CheY
VHILMIDDDYELSEIYANILRKYGHQVVEVDSAQSALDSLEIYPTDVIIMDLLLPHNNGLSFLHELRSYVDWVDIPVIIISNLSANHIGLREMHFHKFNISSYINKSLLTPKLLKSKLDLVFDIKTG